MMGQGLLIENKNKKITINDPFVSIDGRVLFPFFTANSLVVHVGNENENKKKREKGNKHQTSIMEQYITSIIYDDMFGVSTTLT